MLFPTFLFRFVVGILSVPAHRKADKSRQFCGWLYPMSDSLPQPFEFGIGRHGAPQAQHMTKSMYFRQPENRFG